MPESREAAPAYVLRGTLLTDGARATDSVVAVAGGRIAYAGPGSGFDATQFPDAEEVPLPPGSSLLPGLVDLHCHGAAGGGFPTGDDQDCREAVDFLHRHGTTTLLASLVTAPAPELLRAIGVLKALAAEELIAGIHSEGPFLSHARCGAQDPRWLRDPDPELLRQMLDAAGGALKTMTYAPELPGAGELVRMLTGHGVTPSLGHTDADARTAAASLASAADFMGSAAQGFGPHARPTVTHLFNGMPPLHHRDPGPAAACLRLAAAGTAVVELIGDGIHLDPETVRMVFELVGAGNIALVTDSMAATGLPDGGYALGTSEVVVHDGAVTLSSNGALAGGTATLLEVVRTTIGAGVSPADAVLAATLVPARVLGLETEVGSLRAGMRADIVAVDPDFELVTVLRGGRILPRHQNKQRGVT
ncbi:MAG TPA: N-acetylglucosamine-6-phosphate deacetylase [Arthrobacter sp.]|nr:N-acetylglucosamine-6-phosphate deacetylase [Arthrobacter sp.]